MSHDRANLNLKIVRFQDDYYYECQWTGAKRKFRYGIPREGSLERRGTFADPACAAAWVVEKNKLGLLDENKAKKLLQAIAIDLQLVKTGHLIHTAPKFDPGENIDWGYQTDPKSCEHMMFPKSGMINIQCDLHQSGRSNKSSTSTSSSSKSATPQKRLYLYSLYQEYKTPDSQEEPFVSHYVSCPFNETLTFQEPIPIKKIALATFKSKECVLFSEENSEERNPQIAAMFSTSEGLDLKGNVHIMMRKPLHEDGGDVDLENTDVAIAQKCIKGSSSSSSGSESKKKKRQEKGIEMESNIESLLISNNLEKKQKKPK